MASEFRWWRRSRRLFWLILAWVSIFLGFIGALLPVIPTTPFLIVAAWAAPKGSPRLDRWLHEHHHFGPLLRAWSERKAVPRYAKWLTPPLLAGSFTLVWFLGFKQTVLIPMAVIFILVTLYLISRPDA